jgi:hypothetical protein
VTSRRGVRDTVYLSCNNPTSITASSQPDDGTGVAQVANSGTIYFDGLMRTIPPYQYLKNGVTIMIDFIRWQEENRDISCYLTSTWCLMIPALVGRKYIVQAWDHEGAVLYSVPRGWDRATMVMPKKFQVPQDATNLPPPGCHYAPSQPSSAPFPQQFIRHQDSINREWRHFKVVNPELTKYETPVGLTHIGKPWRVKANWFLCLKTFTGVPDINIYLRMFARSGSSMDPI